MPIDCPVCKAENAAGPVCRRCKADLGMLVALEVRRAALLADARGAFENGALPQARELAFEANALRTGDDARRWLAILNLFTNRYAEAWQAYQAANSHG